MTLTQVLAATTALVAYAAGAVSFGTEPLVARWHGGALTLTDFAARYDYDGEALAAGGDRLRVALAKAVYLEIMVSHARAAGLEGDPRYFERLATAQDERLRRAERLLEIAEPSDDEVARAAEGLPSLTHADFDLVIQRCAIATQARKRCREAFAALETRFAAAADPASLATVGIIAGRFDDQPVADLDPHLADRLRAMDVGSRDRLELVAGIAAVRLRGRRTVLDTRAARAGLLAQHRQRALEDLRRRIPEGPRLTESELLLRAFPELSITGDDRRSGVRDWVLADLAFNALPGLAPEPTAEELSEARETLAGIEVRTWAVVGDDDLQRAGTIAETLATTDELATAQLVERLVGAPGSPPQLLRSADLARLPTALTSALRERRIVGPVGVDAKTAAMLGSSCERPCLLVIEGRKREPSSVEVLEEARSSVRGAIGGGLEAWMARFGSRFGVELIVPED